MSVGENNIHAKNKNLNPSGLVRLRVGLTCEEVKRLILLRSAGEITVRQSVGVFPRAMVE